jgi:hypothetical protein
MLNTTSNPKVEAATSNAAPKVKVVRATTGDAVVASRDPLGLLKAALVAWEKRQAAGLAALVGAALLANSAQAGWTKKPDLGVLTVQHAVQQGAILAARAAEGKMEDDEAPECCKEGDQICCHDTLEEQGADEGEMIEWLDGDVDGGSVKEGK